MADAVLRASIATGMAAPTPRELPAGAVASDTRVVVTSAVGVSIRGLYKVFGPTPERVMPLVHQGVSKDELRNVHGHVLGLRDIHLDMKPGAIQVVMGLSDSGKSTLIRHINRLIDPTEGLVRVGEQDVTALSARALREFRRQSTAMVFQRFALFPHATVMGNVQFGLARDLTNNAPVLLMDEALRLGDHIAILRDGQIEQVGTGQQFVLQLANDYIASFVRDVNRGRVIRCRTLVRPGPAVAGPQVEAGLVPGCSAAQFRYMPR